MAAATIVISQSQFIKLNRKTKKKKHKIIQDKYDEIVAILFETTKQKY